MLAIQELEQEGVTFNIKYSRGPFFLMGSQADIDADNAKLGLPKDAPNHLRMKAKGWTGQQMDILFKEAGLSPRNTAVTDYRITAPTMQAHRLVQYAATESNAKGEKMWHALSRRWFMGKDTDIRPIRLDSRDLLLECAEVAGVDLKQANRVLDGEIISEDEIIEEVHKVHAAGIHSIPQIIFEVDGLAEGTWLTQPETKYRTVHHGSGNRASFRAALLKMHRACTSCPEQHRLNFSLNNADPFSACC